MREALKRMYLAYVNDWITVGKFAEYHSIPIMDMQALLQLGRTYHNEDADQ